MTKSAHNTPRDLDAEILRLFKDYRVAAMEAHEAQGDRVRHAGAETLRRSLVTKIFATPAESIVGIALKICLAVPGVYPKPWRFLTSPDSPYEHLQAIYDEALQLGGIDPEYVNTWGDPVEQLNALGKHREAEEVAARQREALARC